MIPESAFRLFFGCLVGVGIIAGIVFMLILKIIGC